MRSPCVTKCSARPPSCASGGQIIQETRHFHEAGYTSPGRAKETAQDYRYFPEPDLEPVAPSRELVEQLRQTIPELPWLSRKRIQQEWGISDEVMRDLVNAGAVELVTATVEHGAPSEQARAWWGNFLMQKANEANIALDELAITPAQVAAVVALVDEGKLSNKLARQVVEGVLAGEGEPEQVMTARGLALVRDDSVTQAAVDEALAANPDVAEKIRGGKVAAAGAIVGAVMKATRGQADAARVRELVLGGLRAGYGVARARAGRSSPHRSRREGGMSVKGSLQERIADFCTIEPLDVAGVTSCPVFVLTHEADGQPSGLPGQLATQRIVSSPRVFCVGHALQQPTAEVASRSEYLAADAARRAVGWPNCSARPPTQDKFERCSWRAGPFGMPMLDERPRGSSAGRAVASAGRRSRVQLSGAPVACGLPRLTKSCCTCPISTIESDDRAPIGVGQRAALARRARGYPARLARSPWT